MDESNQTHKRKNKAVVSAVLALIVVAFTIAATVKTYDSSSSRQVLSHEFDEKEEDEKKDSDECSKTVKSLQSKLSTLSETNRALMARIRELENSEREIIRIDGPASPKQGNPLGRLLDFRGRTSYTLNFDIVTKEAPPYWSGMFHVGNQDTIQSPSILQYPSRRGLRILQLGRKGAGKVTQWNCDPNENVTPPLNRRYTVYIKATDDQFSVYYNGVLRCHGVFDIAPPAGPQKVYFASPWLAASKVVIRKLVFRVY